MKARFSAAPIIAALVALCGCGSKVPISAKPTAPAPSRSPAAAQTVHDYQRLFDSLGDRCYPGDQYPTSLSDARHAESYDLAKGSLPPQPSRRSWGQSQDVFPSSAYYTPVSMLQTASQGPPKEKKRAISSVDDLGLLSDIEYAKYKNNDLILIGIPAAEGEGFRPDDWYTVFRAISGSEAPGVSLDPGPDPRLMQVRYFGGIQQTALGNTFFEADRTLKLFSTGFDNFTCKVWTGRPRSVPTELDLMAADMHGSVNSLEGQGGWHRFWFEPSDEPVETEGLTMRIPKNRLVVKDESIPPGRPSPASARQFASALTSNFLGGGYPLDSPRHNP